MEHMRDRKILVGIGGSIAAYKAPLVIRLLRQVGAQVRVAMTPSAQHFVSPLALSNLAGEPVAIDMFDEHVQQGGSWHIHWAHWADAMLIAPCSAHLLAALAHGLCDTVVACLALALPRTTPLLLAPAMDTTMWEHLATQRNVEILQRDGVIIIPPEEGELASGLWGVGRMPEPQTLVHRLAQVLVGHRYTERLPQHSSLEDQVSRPLQSLQEAVDADRLTAEIELARLKGNTNEALRGKTVLITAGPTREALDAVRFLSNRSSGKMGYALAEAARDRGARVILISGPVMIDPPAGVELIRVESATEMLQAVRRYHGCWDIAIAAAAVADFMPAAPHSGKLKRNEIGERFTIELVRTPDILAELGQSKPSNGVVVGFALEEQQRLEEGIEKLRARGCDIAVLNAINAAESGFEGDWNTVTIVTFQGEQQQQRSYPPAPKRICAEYLLNHVAALAQQRSV